MEADCIVDSRSGVVEMWQRLPQLGSSMSANPRSIAWRLFFNEGQRGGKGDPPNGAGSVTWRQPSPGVRGLTSPMFPDRRVTYLPDG